MKKRMSFLLVVAMVIGLMSSVLAYDDEIVFHSIPWGSSVEEVKALFQNENMKKSVYAEDHFETEILQDDGNTAFYIDSYDYARTGSMLFYSECPFTIAGYDVKGIVCDFMFESDGTDWNRNKPHLRQIGISLKDYNIDDLLQKLTSVYGEPKQLEDDYLWVGENNTAVCLTANYYCLYYGKTDAIDMILQSVEEMKNPVKQPDPNDVGGL